MLCRTTNNDKEVYIKALCPPDPFHPALHQNIWEIHNNMLDRIKLIFNPPWHANVAFERSTL